MVIKLQLNLCYSLRIGIGKGTNIEAELLALWGFLWFANEKDFHSLSILGDSKFIMDWENDTHLLHTIELSHWIPRVRELISCFHKISNHIFRELNKVVDCLSEQALGVGNGLIE